LGVWKVGGDWMWWERLLEMVDREDCNAESELVKAEKYT
jgi:hypothetical protein